MNLSQGRVSVCIATYRRLPRLELLLQDLAAQSRLPDEVVVIDNDAAGSAGAVVQSLRNGGLPFELIYKVQPQKNISITRNWTVDAASGEWLAFIDDDERAPPQWLAGLLAAADHYNAPIVLAPVLPVLPAHAPGWIRRGDFYGFHRLVTGAAVPPNRLRFGNLLLQADWLRRTGTRFDPALGVTGGEDCDLLVRLRNHGARVVWCDEAIVEEPVEDARLNLKWLLKRALRGGQEFGRNTWQGQYAPINFGGRLWFVLSSMLKLLVAALLAVLMLPFGRHLVVARLVQAAANVGKISVLWGGHYREYG